MRSCAKRLSSFFVGLLLLIVTSGVQAGDISARNPILSATDDGYVLAVDFSLSLNPRLEDAVAKGVALYFVVDFELTRARWYWLDEQVASRSQSIQLSYHALTRQYRLSTGALHQSFASLEDALRILSRLRNWLVIDKGVVKPDHTYLAAVRMRLDLTQMPKTFQVNALANRDWNLVSEWARWTFTPSDSSQAGGTGTQVVPVVPAVVVPAAAGIGEGK
ncbi:MAG: DUF4390 domain-containing protein [Candidatus Accumulibacter sp.]|nr:DUF4390 domain-containing protein [Accumulibacter sp.]MBE2259056.1 DUF4390 domain-containing protein [Paracoccaceae bacterium]MCB1940943.1 DUF4390 domain-containing protein [Accumulibacter sp.]MCP5247158.1 DUF4390 domain-containing protein [Accumulibacter sp.]